MIRAGVARSNDSRVQLGAGERITVALIATAADDLRRLQKRAKLSTTDLVNRAITSYEFIDAQMQAGRDLLIRDKWSGETRLVRFL
jgi:hypothetical protein